MTCNTNDFTIKPGDSKTLTVVLKVNGVIRDLTAALTATLEWQIDDGSAAADSKAMTIDAPATDGSVSCTVAAPADLPTVGTYNAEIVVDFGGGQVQTFPEKGFFRLVCAEGLTP